MSAPKAMMRGTSLLLLLAACENTTDLARSRRAGGGLDADLVEEDAGADAAPPYVDTEAGSVALCGKRPCACSNGEDDDGDGRIDGFDGECTGPYDDDELTFAINDVPEGNKRCSDCFYDGNRGADDGCRVAASCNEDGTPSGGTGGCRTCAATPACQDRCLPITPNGCDCFGCCEVWTGDTRVNVLLTRTCSVDGIADPQACTRCVQVDSCRNSCERCELCPGRTLADLPPDCASDAGAYSCDGRENCTTSADCAPGDYCGQGCCAPLVY